MVEQHCHLRNDGKIYPNKSWQNQPVSGLYVHPRTRFLCWKESGYITKRRKIREAKAKVEPRRITISGKQHYLKCKGIWYIAELERHEPKQKSPNEKVVKEILPEAYYDW